MAEEVVGVYPQGLSVIHPIDKRKKKVYRLTTRDLTEEEAVELARPILIVAGAAEEVVKPEKKTAQNQPKKEEAPTLTGLTLSLPNGKEIICSRCHRTPCPRMEERGRNPSITECPYFREG